MRTRLVCFLNRAPRVRSLSSACAAELPAPSSWKHGPLLHSSFPIIVIGCRVTFLVSHVLSISFKLHYVAEPRARQPYGICQLCWQRSDVAARLWEPCRISEVGTNVPANSLSHIDASLSRQPLVKGERLMRHEVNAVMPIWRTGRRLYLVLAALAAFPLMLPSPAGCSVDRPSNLSCKCIAGRLHGAHVSKYLLGVPLCSGHASCEIPATKRKLSPSSGYEPGRATRHLQPKFLMCPPERTVYSVHTGMHIFLSVLHWGHYPLKNGVVREGMLAVDIASVHLKSENT